MTEQLVKVTRYVRTVLDGRIVVARPGDRIDADLAARLGLEHPAAPPVRRARAGAFLPAVWA